MHDSKQHHQNVSVTARARLLQLVSRSNILTTKLHHQTVTFLPHRHALLIPLAPQTKQVQLRSLSPRFSAEVCAHTIGTSTQHGLDYELAMTNISQVKLSGSNNSPTIPRQHDTLPIRVLAHNLSETARTTAPSYRMHSINVVALGGRERRDCAHRSLPH